MAKDQKITDIKQKLQATYQFLGDKVQTKIQDISQSGKDKSVLPAWIIPFLQIASYYNAIWGIAIFMYPQFFLKLFNHNINQSPASLSLLAVAVFILGLGFFLVTLNPFRFHGVLLVGAFAKLLGAFGAWWISDEQTNLEVLWLHILLNDLIWLPFICLSLYLIFKEQQNSEEDFVVPFPYILHNYETNLNNRLVELTHTKPTLLIFLRHLGCTFCREALTEITQKRIALETQARIVLVHMASLEEAEAYFEKYQLHTIEHISDPHCGLYRAFYLERGSFRQLLGFKAIARGFNVSIVQRHGIGKLAGDGFRMPGVFLIYKNQILKNFIHQSVADKPNYTELASCPM